MSVSRRKGSPYFQIRFRLAGREIRATTGTRVRKQAEDLEEELRRRYWRQVKLGEKHFTWNDAIERCESEDSGRRGWSSTKQAIDKLNRLLDGAPLQEIDRDNILRIRAVLARQTHNGKPMKPSSVNRVLAELRKILNRCVTDWQMLDAAPKVPLFRLQKTEPIWATRDQIHSLLGVLPTHSRDMALLACSTGMRRCEVTRMQRSHVDLNRATAYVPAMNAKNDNARVVPLNADAIAVLKPWMDGDRSKAKTHDPVYVFSFRGHAPIKQLATRMWRRACKEVGMVGFTFHKLRHTWASWQLQGGTPLSHLQELGGWKSFEMVQRYAHLAPGHLAQYASNSLLGDDTRTAAEKLKSKVA